MSLKLSDASQKEIDDILTRYPQKRAATLPILHVIQDEIGHVPEEAEEFVANITEVPAIKVREVISFYTLYHRQPIGKHHFQVCRTLSCWLRGAPEIIKHLEKRLNLKDGETSTDKKFTLTQVECLAACETAPMMQLNEKYVGQLSCEKIDEILDELK